MVILLANPRTQEWRLAIPTQRAVTHGLHVGYDPESVEVPDGFQPFGTIHSHAEAAAFHSGTDNADEASTDGLHITIGNLDSPSRTHTARWMLHGKPFPVQLSEVVEPDFLPPVPPEWMARITPVPKAAGMDDWAFGGSYPPAAFGEDVPADLQEEYDEYMAEMHERFLTEIAGRPLGDDKPTRHGKETTCSASFVP